MCSVLEIMDVGIYITYLYITGHISLKTWTNINMSKYVNVPPPINTYHR